MQIFSTSFNDGYDLDVRFAHDGVPGGENLIPDLEWTDVPDETKSFALTCFDPDAPTGSGFWHLIAWDIPLHVRSIDEGATFQSPTQTTLNDYGFEGYGGPNPPVGDAHKYVFTIYAMPDETLDVPAHATSAMTRFLIVTGAIESASVTGMFAQP